MTMASAALTPCPACGAAASGRYCAQCGASLTAEARPCPRCGHAIEVATRFCGRCGASVSAGSVRPSGFRASTGWLVAAGAGALALGVLLVVLIGRESRAAAPPAEIGPAGVGVGSEGTPPDISAMSPRERFDRLYNRVMRAAESGDDATAAQFTPMALLAYSQLGATDPDARYHVAMLLMHTGQTSAAAAVADSVRRETPGHLFGFLLQGTLARWSKDSVALAKAYRGFLGRYDVELATDKPEYKEHQRGLSEFRSAALAAKR